MTQYIDALRTFEGDLAVKVTKIPIKNKNIPTDSASMRVALNNTSGEALFLDSPVRDMSGEFNIQISHQIGTNKYEMARQAGFVLEHYYRGVTLAVDGLRMVISDAYQTSVYSSEAHSHINVIVKFQLFA